MSFPVQCFIQIHVTYYWFHYIVTFEIL